MNCNMLLTHSDEEDEKLYIVIDKDSWAKYAEEKLSEKDLRD